MALPKVNHCLKAKFWWNFYSYTDAEWTPFDQNDKIKKEKKIGEVNNKVQVQKENKHEQMTLYHVCV